MFKKISLAILAIIIAFLGYVSTRDGKFHYERSGVINSTPEKIFAFISDFKLGNQWNPYAMKDPNMKVAFKGTTGQVGSIMEFDGNKEAGTGNLEILKVVPNQSVEIKLTMTKPIHAENNILYTLTPEGSGTKFTWAMYGDGGFMGKLMNVLIDCEKMMTTDFDKGIANLKNVIEKK